MKKLLFIMFVSLGLSNAQAQFINVYHYTPYQNFPICEAMFQVNGQFQFPGGPSNFTITVDWLDGTTTDSTFSANGYFQITFNHAYAGVGSYPANYTVYSDYLASNVVANVPVEFLIASSNSCGFVPFIYIYQLSPNIVYDNVPLDFIGNDGSTITILPVMLLDTGSVNPIYSGLNPALAPYVVSVNSDWLFGNGLIQLSPNEEITGFSAEGFAIVPNGEVIFELDCATAVTDPDAAISYCFASVFIAPLQTGYLNLNFCNYACQNISDASVTVQFPNDFVPNTSGLTNASFSTGVLTFDLEDLDACQTVSIPCTFPGNTPAGTQICFPVQISAAGDTDLSNNNDTICGIVLNSYDPNDKQVNHPATINPDMQEEFVYQIRFQNDGNFPAVNVVVRDTISSNLDISTFRLLETSHPGAASVNPTTREITFTFNAIWLESSDVDLEASQGYVVYEIKEAEGLVEGDAIENTAYIFFDFNPAIVTNTTVNTNAYPVGVIENDKPQLSMYPNPASSALTFSGAAVQKVVIYDVLGQVVLTRNITSNTLSLTGLTNGVYFVEMHTETGVQTQRLVVNK